MRRLVIDPLAPSDASVAEAASVVAAGGLVAFPTDTLYGLAADPRNGRAVEAVFLAKGRPLERALPLIVADIDAVATVARLTPLGRQLARDFWPGPLSIVLDADPSLASAVHGGTLKVAVRVPDLAVARLLARGAGGAIVSTSANRSGQPATADPDEVAASMRDWVDLCSTAARPPAARPRPSWMRPEPRRCWCGTGPCRGRAC